MRSVAMSGTTIITFIDSATVKHVVQLNKILSTVKEGIVCLTTAKNFEAISQADLERTLASADIVHSGLLGSGRKAFEYVQLITFNWNFLTPDPTIQNYSWKATSDFIAFNVSAWLALGGFDESYESVNGALMDFSYSTMTQGGRILYSPAFMQLDAAKEGQIGKKDERRFVEKYFPRNAAALYKILRGNFSTIHIGNTTMNIDSKTFKLVGGKRKEVKEYTAIIPTINRYDYLNRAIQSLLDTDFPPSEIIVVDQTPRQSRISGYYDSFLSLPHFTVIFLDVAGQSISRNTGIDKAKYEWIYLFDDDSLCWKDCMKEHKYLVEYSDADCSTGLSLSPEQSVDSIESMNRFYRSADVLDTGNCLIRKSTLVAVGRIDNAFNRGPGADDDLGKRLYLRGYSIILNHKAIRTHFKAKAGGLREHGAWWRNKSTLLGAYPPPTQLYSIKKYYPNKFWLLLVASLVIKAKKRYNLLSYIVFLILLPFKFWKSIRQARALTNVSRSQNVPASSQIFIND